MFSRKFQIDFLTLSESAAPDTPLPCPLIRQSSPPIPLRLHRRRHLAKPRNVTPRHQTRKLPLRRLHVLLGRFQPILEAILHNQLQSIIHLLRRPRNALRVLRHFEPGDGHTARVGRFTGRVPDRAALLGFAVVLKDVNGFGGAAHVAAFGDEFRACIDEGLGFFARDFVLRRAGEGNIDFAAVGPGAGALDVLELFFVAFRAGELR